LIPFGVGGVVGEVVVAAGVGGAIVFRVVVFAVVGGAVVLTAVVGGGCVVMRLQLNVEYIPVLVVVYPGRQLLQDV